MTAPHTIAHSRDNAIRFFEWFCKHHAGRLQGKVAIDLSAGTGYIAHLFEQAGSTVRLFDLIPAQNRFARGACAFIDLQQPFPIETHAADVAICAETIEHLPNQLFFFQEAARIIKPGGLLLLTTPNTSSLRSRLAQFAMESEHYGQPAPNELDAFVDWGDGRYLGKIFLSGILRLRTLAAIGGLTLQRSYRSSFSSTSVFLLFLYPLLWWLNYRALRKQMKRKPESRATYLAVFRINLALKTLLNKHLLLEFTKT
jgi:SAM-dependent methyltransferase